jgi:hypothetical protein
MKNNNQNQGIGKQVGVKNQKTSWKRHDLQMNTLTTPKFQVSTSTCIASIQQFVILPLLDCWMVKKWLQDVKLLCKHVCPTKSIWFMTLLCNLDFMKVKVLKHRSPSTLPIIWIVDKFVNLKYLGIFYISKVEFKKPNHNIGTRLMLLGFSMAFHTMTLNNGTYKSKLYAFRILGTIESPTFLSWQ